ncbi:ACT domain-containing protein [Haloimpatiens sp. FM7330]|uniref:ACT domain-containing protein n=1 Tax=Haloimpatiens sp. FM7330 TaxID=3298610 RepID=UPI003637B087
MKNKYLIVDSRVLPDVFEKVIEVKQLLYKGKVKDISEGVKKVGISRSTYYKYKDAIFTLSESVKGQKATMALLLEHERGTLSGILDKIALHDGNILTINQDIPINNAANVTITFNMSGLDVDLNELIADVEKMRNVIKVNLIAME